MGRGPTERRGFGSIGLQSSQTLGSALVGGGVHQMIHAALLIRPARQAPQVSGADLPLGTDRSVSGGGSYADGAQTATLPSGVWLISGTVSMSWPSGETGAARASLENSNGDPIAPEIIGGAGGTSTITFPAYPYVSTGLYAARMLTGVDSGVTSTPPSSSVIRLTAVLVAHT